MFVLKFDREIPIISALPDPLQLIKDVIDNQPEMITGRLVG